MKKLYLILAAVVCFVFFSSMALVDDAPVIEEEPVEEMVNLVDVYRENPELLEKRILPMKEAKWLATIADAVAPNSDDNCKIAIMECIINRTKAYGFPNTIEGVCSEKNQWQGYKTNSGYTNETYRLAKIFRDSLNEAREPLINSDMVFMRIDHDGIYFRNSWDSTYEYMVPFFK